MENQHRAIKGYRELNEAEIALMNEIKSKGAELGEIISKLETMHNAEGHTFDSSADTFKAQCDTLNEVRRWTAIGKTDLQRGLMALTRAVARPTFF